MVRKAQFGKALTHFLYQNFRRRGSSRQTETVDTLHPGRINIVGIFD